ncbi:hypothetical protein BRADI_3g07292v3 [Brachypodium distachyon]|uniref:DUF868 domain-containing protein n=2 Tax=Brachypodium distachyon TaxID=15368 RepID=A0A0Q3I0F5_BRADI|nr:hypothetical protein BRADI_3g07292v3 [Brachypodium distachyon]
MHKRSRSCEPSRADDRGGCHGGPTASDDSITAKAASSSCSAQCSAMSAYLAKISGAERLVSAVWHKSIINQSFTITIDRPPCGGGGDDAGSEDDDGSTLISYKVEMKPWPFWSKKGLKSFYLDGDRVDLVWDLRTARFTTSSPEPAHGYYVALVNNEEVVLVFGDQKKEAYKRAKTRPSLIDPVPVCRRESVVGRRSFVGRAKLTGKKEYHDIAVESLLAGPREPEMSIAVEGHVVVRVKNLQWKFRGNETVIVDEVPVQVLWDVHDWIFAGPGATQAVFVLKPGAPPEIRADDPGPGGWDYGSSILGDATDYSFFLHAWKTD